MNPKNWMMLCALLVLATPAFARDPAPLSAYGDLPGVEEIAIAPGGARIAAISRVKQERRLLVIDSGKIVSSIPVEELKIRGLNWVGDDMLILEKSDTVAMPFGFTTRKNELWSAIIVKPNGEKPATVFANTPSMSAAIRGAYGFRQVEGKWTGFYSGIKYKRTLDGMSWDFDHGRPYLFAVDLANNRPTQVARPAIEGHWRDWLVDGQGQVTAAIDITESGNWKIENAAGTSIVQGSNPSGDVALVSFGKTTGSVIYSLDD